MAVELSSLIYNVPSLSGKLTKLSLYHDKDNGKLFQADEEREINHSPEKSAEGMPASTETPTSPPPTTTEPYDIKLVTPVDYERVLDHLRNFFFKDEPLNINVKLLENTNTCKELEDFTKKNLDYNCSYMAVSASNQVVGVSVNSVDRPTDQIDDDEECTNPKFQKILNLLTAVDNEVDIFKRFSDVDTVMNCKVLSVDSNWRGRGIAKNLLDKTRDVARKEGYGLMRVDCTSHYSAKAIARLGFECIYVKKYADHKEDGKVVFDPEPPHNEVAVYVQQITPAQKL